MPTETPSVLQWADRQLGRLAGLFAVFGAFAVVGLMGVTVVAVAWRYGLNQPIFGIEDISIVTLTLVAGASVAYGARHQSHVSVNVISLFAGRKTTRYTDVVMRVLTLGILCLAVWSMFIKACGMEKACITSNLAIEHRPFYYLLGVSLALYALNVLLQLLIGLTHFSGDDPNEIED